MTGPEFTLLDIQPNSIQRTEVIGALDARMRYDPDAKFEAVRIYTRTP